MKKLMVTITIVLAIISLSACGTTGKQKAKRAEKLLSERYDESFKVIKVFPHSSSLWFTVQAVSDERPSVVFNADIDTKDNEFADSYVERIVCEKISDLASQNFGSVSEDFYIFTRAIGPQPYCTDTNITIEEYMELSKWNRMRMELVVDISDTAYYDELYNGIYNILNGITCGEMDVCLYKVDDKKFIEMKTFFSENGDNFGMEYLRLTDNVESFVIKYDNSGLCTMSKQTFIANMKVKNR